MRIAIIGSGAIGGYYGACLASISLCNLIIIALKTTANAAIFPRLKSLIKKETLLLTLQNGMGNEEELAKYYGKDRILGIACFVCLTRTAPGVIPKWREGTIRLGECHTPPQKHTYKLATLWQKLCGNIPFGGLSILTGGISTAAILHSTPLKKPLLLKHETRKTIRNVFG